MIDVELHLDDSMDRVLEGIDRTDNNIQKAIKRALRKVLRWLEKEVHREIQDATQIKQKTIKSFRRLFIKMGDEHALVWIGLNPLPAHEAGRVRWSQMDLGAIVRGQLLTGSFFRAVYGGTKKIWIRTSRNKEVGLPRYNPLRKYKALPDDSPLKGRFPVELVGVEIDGTAKAIEKRLADRAVQRFETILEQEVNYALNVEK